MSLSNRLGLSETGAPGDRLSATSYNQSVKARVALATTLAAKLGGEGVWQGGAAAIGDFGGSGTQYPAVILCICDDSGYAWLFKTAGMVEITFLATDADPGALYAIIQQQSGVSPASAEGGITQVQFVAQDDADPAPAHSLKLGTGTIASSAFASWTEEAGVRIDIAAALGAVTPSRTITAGAGLSGGGDLSDDRTVAVAVGGITLEMLANLADNTILGRASSGAGVPEAIALAANQFLARSATGGLAAKTITDFGLSLVDDADAATARSTLGLGAWARLTPVRLSKAGPPVSGSYSTGDVTFDGIGAVWQCISGGSPGTWVQLTPGRATSAPVAGDFGGGAILEGYRFYHTGNQQEWFSFFNSGSHYAWESVVVGCDVISQSANPIDATALSATATPYLMTMPAAMKVHVLDLTCRRNATSADSTNKWTLSLRNAGADKGTVDVTTAGVGDSSITFTGVTGVIDTTADAAVSFRATKVNSPGTLRIDPPGFRFRWILT